MEAAADALEAAGFVVPDRRSDAEVDKVVGYVADREPARLRRLGHKSGPPCLGPLVRQPAPPSEL